MANTVCTGAGSFCLEISSLVSFPPCLLFSPLLNEG
uniref:Uncharacterized protein n=1 Tax=Anguilla anguilla TaxID=7936 RepID=A0A0E9TLM1_ANGAN